MTLQARVAKWQTQGTQNPSSFGTCRFESGLGHQLLTYAPNPDSTPLPVRRSRVGTSAALHRSAGARAHDDGHRRSRRAGHRSAACAAGPAISRSGDRRTCDRRRFSRAQCGAFLCREESGGVGLSRGRAWNCFHQRATALSRRRFVCRGSEGRSAGGGNDRTLSCNGLRLAARRHCAHSIDLRDAARE